MTSAWRIIAAISNAARQANADAARRINEISGVIGNMCIVAAASKKKTGVWRKNAASAHQQHRAALAYRAAWRRSGACSVAARHLAATA